MKKLLIAGLCLFSLTAFADETEEGAGKNFEEHKAKMIEGIDKRIAGMNELKSCVSAAKDRDAVKACREKMKDMREDMREERKERKEKRKKK